MMEEITFDPVRFTKESAIAWDLASQNYDRLITPRFLSFTRALIDWAGLKGNEKVLDVACGSGLASLAIAGSPNFRGSVLGVDLSPEMVALAGDKAKKSKLGSMEFKVMNAEKLDLPNESFDSVFCQLGLMLFAKPDQALSEMRRVLKTGGQVFLCVQGSPDKMRFTSIVMKAMMKHAPQLKVPGAPTLYSFGGEGILAQALTQAGFADVQDKRYSGVFSFNSAQEYWDTLVAGAGKTRSMLESLSAQAREAIREDSILAAKAYQNESRLEIPYEVVLARGFKK